VCDVLGHAPCDPRWPMRRLRYRESRNGPQDSAPGLIAHHPRSFRIGRPVADLREKCGGYLTNHTTFRGRF
jgi:hypothetical protein